MRAADVQAVPFLEERDSGRSASGIAAGVRIRVSGVLAKSILRAPILVAAAAAAAAVVALPAAAPWFERRDLPCCARVFSFALAIVARLWKRDFGIVRRILVGDPVGDLSGEPVGDVVRSGPSAPPPRPPP